MSCRPQACSWPARKRHLKRFADRSILQRKEKTPRKLKKRRFKENHQATTTGQQNSLTNTVRTIPIGSEKDIKPTHLVYSLLNKHTWCDCYRALLDGKRGRFCVSTKKRSIPRNTSREAIIVPQSAEREQDKTSNRSRFKCLRRFWCWQGPFQRCHFPVFLLVVTKCQHNTATSPKFAIQFQGSGDRDVLGPPFGRAVESDREI